MAKKIFKNFVLLASLTLVVLVITALFAFGSYVDRNTREELGYEANLIAGGFNQGYSLEQAGTPGEKRARDREELAYFRSLPMGTKRVTVVKPDGSVLFDYDVDAGRLGNHKDRPEIKSAFETGKGLSERYSDTLAQKTIYYAVRLDNGDVMRLAVTRNTLLAVLYDMSAVLLFIAALILGLAVLLARKLARKIVEPINRMDFEKPDLGEGYEELDPLLMRMRSQKEALAVKEAEILNQKKELESIIKNLTEGFILIDRQNRIISINDSALDLLSGKTLPVGGKKPESLLEVTRQPLIIDAVESALRGEKNELELKLGSRNIYLMVSPMLNYEQQVIGAMLNAVDITDIVQREELRREFTANVSHELKTPLTSISGYAEIMKSGMVPPEDMVQFSDKIYSEAQKLIGLVQDILTLSRLDAEQEEQRSFVTGEAQSLTDILLHVKEDLEFKAESMEVELVTAFPCEPAIHAPARSLYRIAYNLAENAIKYNRKGGKVILSTLVEDGMTGLSVRDTGIGIDKQEQGRIFERFYRVDKGRSQEIEGTGLGLSIVKKAVLLTGGKIVLTSIPEEGTEVRVLWEEKK